MNKDVVFMLKNVKKPRARFGKKQPRKAGSAKKRPEPRQKVLLKLKPAGFHRSAARPAKLQKKAIRHKIRGQKKTMKLPKSDFSKGIRKILVKPPAIHLRTKSAVFPPTSRSQKKAVLHKAIRHKVQKQKKIAAKGKIKARAKTANKKPDKNLKITLKEAPAPQAKKEMSRELQETLAKADVRHWLINLGGENALEVIKNLNDVPNDDELAKKLKIKVSDVRASLNKMHNEGLVSYIRDKNSETGWYSYTWALNEKKIQKWVAEKNSSYCEAYMPKEGIVLYFCKDCGLESTVKFEVASEYSFKCPTCSSALDFLDEDKFERFKKPKGVEK